MICPSCAHENRPAAKFCEECATPLKRTCTSCGSELRPTAKFCDECAAPVVGSAPHASPVEPAGERKVVTIVFADLVGSTALHERLDPESARRFMEGYYEAMRGAVERHDGTVTQLLGDGVKAVFGIPRVAEDDAIRAVRAAVAMQESFRVLAEQERGAVGATGLRVAVNTGEVVAQGTSEIIGDPVNVAARLQEQGRDGDVVIGEATEQLVSSLVTLAPLGSFSLKGRTEAVAAYRVDSLEPPEGAATMAFVGREEELARIGAVYDDVVARPATQLAVLLGSPGLGKSRLIGEFAGRRSEEATVVDAHCDAAGGASFAPLADALRELLGIEAGASGESARATIEAALAGGTENARIAGGIAALLAGTPAAPEETFFVVRRLLAGLTATRPVILVIDDLQWAEPLLLDLVEHLVQWGRGVPLLVLVGARPELRDVRSSLVLPGGLVADVVTLAGLDAGAAMRLAANVIGAGDLPAAVAAKVLATSEGNPLFVGELVRMLVHEGALTRVGDRWIAGVALAALEMPPTIHALLSARIERLGPGERTALERAAVVGRHFSRSAVLELLPSHAADLDAQLESLLRNELIERDSGWLLGEPVLRFHHVLIRDAAYRSLLKGTRADLHARLADWMEAKVGSEPEHDETIGRHLEQAHQLLGQLGPIDDAGRRIGERAATRLAAAGRRALARDDVSLAASLVGRALDRLEAEDPARAELALDWCEALLAAGDVATAAVAIDELARFTEGSDRLRAWHTCFAAQRTVLTAPEGLDETAREVAAAATSLAEEGDATGEAKAHYVQALALARLGKVGACEAALDQALAAARRAGDRRRANTVLAIAPLAALWGPSPVTRASGRCLDVVRVLRISQDAPAVEAVALSCQGVLEALRGRTDAARRMIASAREMVEELGITQRLLEVDVFAGQVALLEGDASAADRVLRSAYQGLRELGLGNAAAQAAALLARAQLGQGRVDDAEALSRESEALAGDDLKAAIAWRGVRAEALARRGEHAAAVELASKAVELAAATDALLDHADARLALAAALRAAGRAREADAEERRAHELWETKGATLLGEGVRRGAGEPAGADAGRPALRRVRENVAAKAAERNIAATSAGDADALRATLADGFEVVQHAWGATLGVEEAVASFRWLFEAREMSWAQEPLATLGSSLALLRRSHTSVAPDDGEAGPTALEVYVLIEAEEPERVKRAEVFASDRLGDAVARLYARHAELLLGGPERERAEMTAQCVAWMLTRSTDHRAEDVMAPDLRAFDHRTVGHGAIEGHEFLSRARDAWTELVEEADLHIDDVLALGADTLLRRVTRRGTLRASGGAFEFTCWRLSLFGADGRLARAETFDVGKEADVLARLDELLAGRAPAETGPRVRPNGATAACERFVAAVDSGERAVIEAEIPENLVYVHHESGTTLGRREQLATWVGVSRSERLEHRVEPLATLGESLALAYQWLSISGLRGDFADFGAAEIDNFVVVESPDGRLQRIEHFGTDHLDDAIFRLYELHAEGIPDGPERARASAMAGSLRAFLLAWELPDPFAAALAGLEPGFESADHRHLSNWSLRGAQTFVEHMRALREVADEIDHRTQRVLALEPNALLIQRMHSGRERHGGGIYERPFLVLLTAGSDGRLDRAEWFDADREAEALARLDELTEAPVQVFSNPVTRLNERFARAWAARDWDAVTAIHSPSCRFDDRRPLMRAHADLEATARTLFEVPNGRWWITPLATRGERLALSRVVFEGDVPEGGGELAIDYLNIDELDDDGRLGSVVMFDPADLDAARAELDACWEAGEGAAHPLASAWLAGYLRTFAGRDWDAMTALFSPDLISHNHRLVGWGTRHGPAGVISTMQAQFELAPDTQARVDHVRTRERGLILEYAWYGTREGGPFENLWIDVFELDERGRARRCDVWEPGQVERARSRFADIETGATPPQPFANTAATETDRMARCFRERDWDGLLEMLVADFHCSDRRHLVQLELDRERFVELTREIGALHSTRLEWTLLATRGDRLALSHVHIEMSGEDVGTSEFEHVNVFEVDADGELIAVVRFDPDALDAAYAELDARFAAGERAAPAAVWRRLRAALEQRDWDAIADLCASGIVVRDHRLVGFGTRSGQTTVREAQRAMIELAPDAQIRTHHLRTSSRGFIAASMWVGTRDGGPFEIPILEVIEVDARDRVARLDLYDAHYLEAALARFEEIRADRLRIPPNAASAGLERWTQTFQTAFDAGDWEPMRATCAPGFVFEDRRSLSQLSGDAELMIGSARERAVSGARPSFEHIGTAGGRVAVFRALWSGGPAEGRFEIEYNAVIEVDEDRLLTAIVLINPDDRRATQREAWRRWAAIEPAMKPVLEVMWEVMEAFHARDRERLRACYADDVVAVDHRHVGIGRIEGGDAYVDSIAVLWDLAPSTSGEWGWVLPATAPHGVLTVIRRFGDVPDGGAFESEYLQVLLVGGGRITHVELFDIDAPDAALARFDEIAHLGQAGRAMGPASA